MARSDTYGDNKKSGNVPNFESTLEGDFNTDHLGKIPVESEKETSKIPVQTINIAIDSGEETVRKTFVIKESINDTLDSIVNDPFTGKKKKGSKGLLSKILNNALLKELVDLGVYDSDKLEELEEYTEIKK